MWEISRPPALGPRRLARPPDAVVARSADVRINFGVMPGDGLPIVYGFQASPDYRSEKFVQAEAGYRILLGANASIDLTAFGGSYEGLSAAQPIAPIVELTPAPAPSLRGTVS